MGSLCSSSAVSPVPGSENSHKNNPKSLSGFYLFDFGSSVFTNSILLIPLLITEQTKKQAKHELWMETFTCEAQITCNSTMLHLNPDICSSTNSCTYNATSLACEDALDTCVPRTENRCCVEDPESLTVKFFGQKINYASVFAYLVSISVILQVSICIFFVFMCVSD